VRVWVGGVGGAATIGAAHWERVMRPKFLAVWNSDAAHQAFLFENARDVGAFFLGRSLESYRLYSVGSETDLVSCDVDTFVRRLTEEDDPKSVIFDVADFLIGQQEGAKSPGYGPPSAEKLVREGYALRKAATVIFDAIRKVSAAVRSIAPVADSADGGSSPSETHPQTR
jgi:hypothetical protein